MSMSIDFSYQLDKSEQTLMHELTHRLLFEANRNERTLAQYRADCIPLYHAAFPFVCASFDSFFASCARDVGFFVCVKISDTDTLTPKDAHAAIHDPSIYAPKPYVNSNTDECVRAEEETRNKRTVTIDSIEQELQYMCVHSTNDMMHVLMHSYRVMMEMRDSNEVLSIQLKPWRDDFFHCTETRVWVRGGRVRAVSEYYTDLIGGYFNIDAFDPCSGDNGENVIESFFDLIIGTVQMWADNGSIAKTVVCDVALDKNMSIVKIECNTDTGTCDECLFDSNEHIDECSKNDMIEVRYGDRSGRTITHRQRWQHTQEKCALW